MVKLRDAYRPAHACVLCFKLLCDSDDVPQINHKHIDTMEFRSPSRCSSHSYGMKKNAEIKNENKKNCARAMRDGRMGSGSFARELSILFLFFVKKKSFFQHKKVSNKEPKCNVH
jgi:hypothetical protein